MLKDIWAALGRPFLFICFEIGGILFEVSQYGHYFEESFPLRIKSDKTCLVGKDVLGEAKNDKT